MKRKAPLKVDDLRIWFVALSLFVANGQVRVFDSDDFVARLEKEMEPWYWNFSPDEQKEYLLTYKIPTIGRIVRDMIADGRKSNV